MDTSSLQEMARRLLGAEIERIVAEAEAAGDIVRAGYHAGQLLAVYPAAEFSLGRIVDELILEATRVGVPIEIGRSSGD